MIQANKSTIPAPDLYRHLDKAIELLSAALADYRESDLPQSYKKLWAALEHARIAEALLNHQVFLDRESV
jgi:hypothetical protein